MKTLIQLIGAQPLPNLLPPLYIKPDQTILVCTPQTDQVRRRIESVIGQCRSICCDAYDIAGLVKALYEELAGQQESELIFNLTGGTKAMVLAANQVALKRGAQVVYLESERTRNLLYEYRYDDQQTLQLQSKTELPTLINIEQFLDAHIGRGEWQEAGRSKDVGGNFEQAVADALQARLQAEVKQGIKFLGSKDGKRPQVDLDIVVRCGNQFARIECKSQGKTTTLDAAKQLNLVNELLGIYTRKFIAMSNSPNPDHQAVYEATHTQVIELPSFDGQSLNDYDQQKLADTIAEAIGCR
ncbi:DUF1887 family CARF protein [Caldilinea sp.]|jgi:hypothetical protein|uniref:Card1-like endonuclease domain-containing protein n=1 Tax=Caldilinea sp. TaxID=2293560 RepID=UPI001B29AF60|nr:DUF1887 family CARF protein [Caldilinea sp.]MBO9395012.1 DUF1887 family protein [Caldilinea sp.]